SRDRRASGSLQAFSDSSLLPGLGSHRGKLQVEAGVAAKPAADLDGATVLLNDTVCDRQTEARPFTCSLGGEEGIVDAVDMLGIDAVAAVEDVDLDAAVFLVRRLHFQHATRSHGVARVDEQIQEHLLQLTGIPGDG